jgi:hypothetical protein
MDETQLSARKRFRVLTGNGHLPLVKAEAKLPHIQRVKSVPGTLHWDETLRYRLDKRESSILEQDA